MTATGVLAGRTALITGGASGMGRAASLLFASEGARVVIADRDAEASAETATLITDRGGAVDTHLVDVGDQATLGEWADALPYDVLDVFFNHAAWPSALTSVVSSDMARVNGSFRHASRSASSSASAGLRFTGLPPRRP